MSAQRDRMLFKLEQKLARVSGRISAEDAASLIADDFMEFGTSGKVWSKADIVMAIPQLPPSDLTLENFNVRELSGSVCLATYKAGASLRSSIWCRIGENWQMIFHQSTALLLFLALAFLSLVPIESKAQTHVADLSCTSGPYRVRLPKTYKALRVLAPLKRERVLQKEEHEGVTAVYRELRFNGLELELVTYSNKPNQYVLSSAVLSTAAWRIGGQLRVGTAARIALKGLATPPYPSDGEVEFNGEADSIRVTLSRGRVVDVEFSCATE